MDSLITAASNHTDQVRKSRKFQLSKITVLAEGRTIRTKRPRCPRLSNSTPWPCLLDGSRIGRVQLVDGKHHTRAPERLWGLSCRSTVRSAEGDERSSPSHRNHSPRFIDMPYTDLDWSSRVPHMQKGVIPRLPTGASLSCSPPHETNVYTYGTLSRPPDVCM